MLRRTVSTEAFISMPVECSIRWHRNMFITHSECVLSIYSEISHAHLEMLFFKLIPPHNVSITSKQLTYCLFARKKKGSLNCYYMYIRVRTWNHAACVSLEIRSNASNWKLWKQTVWNRYILVKDCCCVRCLFCTSLARIPRGRDI